MRRLTECLGWFGRGVLMGVADLVPGVSGGTIALITGIYPRLLAALAGLQPRLLSVWWQRGWRAFWQALDGTFLVLLSLGIGSAILVFSHLIGWLLVYIPMVLWGFFAGVLLLALTVLMRDVAWSKARVLLALGAGCLALSLLWLDGLQLPTSGWGVFVGGAVAIIALLLPGISGSLILLMLGLYLPAMEAVRSFDLSWLMLFGAGCVAGILMFSRLLHQLLQHYYQATLAALTGLVMGALPRLWPWQSALGDEHWAWQWPDSLLSLFWGIFGVILGLVFFRMLQKWLLREHIA